MPALNTPPFSASHSVCIVGGGIAGLVLSQLLQRAGIAHVVLSRTEKQRAPALGETVPPSAYALLDQLGLTMLFERHGTRTFGYHARWGSERVSSQEFFGQRPRPYGLKLDKAALLAGLRAKTAPQVIPIEAVHCISTDAQGALITYQSDQQTYQIRANLVADATGRARAVLKRLGIGQQAFDNTVATTCHLPRHHHPQLGHAVYVESFAEGWGIVSHLDEARSAMTLFTNKGNPLLRELRQFSGWHKALSHTVSLKDFLAPEHLGAISGQPANSSRANALAGDGWLAVGDAAIAFDPLSSHGITNALYGAQRGFEAIRNRLLSGNPEAFVHYAQTLDGIFQAYLEQLDGIYATEKRWSGPFWQQTRTGKKPEPMNLQA